MGLSSLYWETSPYATLFAVAKARYSCRAFDSRQVPKDDIENVLEIARTSPSDCNTQPASIFIISGATLDRLRSDMYETAARGGEQTSDIPPIGTYTGIFQERRRECGWSLYNAVGVQRGDRESSRRQSLENFHFFGAPHLAIVTAHKDLAERGIFDAGIYLGHFLLGAQSKGIATASQGAIAHYSDIIRKHAPIAQELNIICGVSFGYDLKDHAANSFRTSRADLSDSIVFVD